jgi:hypothetical protein
MEEQARRQPPRPDLFSENGPKTLIEIVVLRVAREAAVRPRMAVQSNNIA